MQKYPTPPYAFGSSPAQVPGSPAGQSNATQPIIIDGAIASFERMLYSGDDHDAFTASLRTALRLLQRDFSGATFGIDAATGMPVPFEGAIEQAIFDMLGKSPALGREIHANGGWMTTTFEFRPVRQPANGNLYLLARYAAKENRYTLTSILDEPSRPIREDITGIVVDMPGDIGGSAP